MSECWVTLKRSAAGIWKDDIGAYMKKQSILIVINQFFKGGAETALVNLFRVLPREKYEIDLLIFDQIDLKGSIPLIPQIPDWVHVINVAEREGALAFLKKTVFKAYRDLFGKQLFRGSAKTYPRGRFYDVAISYGEWFSSSLVAKYVTARRKYVWIHADMDKASFLHPDILRYQERFDGYIFTSKYSMDAALQKYPQLGGRAYVVHNQVDGQLLRDLSEQPIEEGLPKDHLPILLTVANIREEKNHLRQVEAMKLLFDEGVRFHWINIGSLADFGLAGRVKRAVKDAGLEDHFHLTGAMENPYAWMRRADAVCVLSDHESWSMVITEAKRLGVPVIATRTSGALEQIVDGESGLLCGFTAEEIARRINDLLSDPALGERIRENLDHAGQCDNTSAVLESLLSNTKKKVLYAFDDLNYVSGARNAALGQARMLEAIAQVDLFSIESIRDKTLADHYRVLSMGEGSALKQLSVPIRSVLRDPQIPHGQKLLRCSYAILARAGQESLIPDLIMKREMASVFEDYDAVFVVSEASKIRKFVSERKHPVKVQWIHTDYAAWRERSAWTRAVTKHDAQIYQTYDSIVCLNQTLRKKFIAIYPQFAEKTIAAPNPVQRDEILRKAAEPSPVQVDASKRNLITIGRFEQEKRYDRLLEIAAELKKQGFLFHWYFVGDGVLFPQIKDLRDQHGLQSEVTLTGALQNPCPLLKQCDLMVLFSEYEGTPVTIDEAKVLGVPVLANDVGGIREQLSYVGAENAVCGITDAREFASQIIKPKK